MADLPCFLRGYSGWDLHQFGPVTCYYGATTDILGPRLLWCCVRLVLSDATAGSIAAAAKYAKRPARRGAKQLCCGRCCLLRPLAGNSAGCGLWMGHCYPSLGYYCSWSGSLFTCLLNAAVSGSLSGQKLSILAIGVIWWWSNPVYRPSVPPLSCLLY